MSLRRNLKKPLFKKDWFHLFFATGAFVGFIPPFPGTLGALEGVFLYQITLEMALYVKLLLSIFFILIGLLSSSYVSVLLNNKDPDEVVIDEVAGAYIACLGKTTILELVLVFILFRIIDITKPFPLKRLESLRGGWGIMLDDILAGIMTNLIVGLIIIFSKVSL
jgi:phosphatidylglycerophosphatase A